jgi:hypothetical protein
MGTFDGLRKRVRGPLPNSVSIRSLTSRPARSSSGDQVAVSHNDGNNGSLNPITLYEHTRASGSAGIFPGNFDLNESVLVPTDTLEDVYLTVSALAYPGNDAANLGQTTTSTVSIDPAITISAPGYSIEFSSNLASINTSAVPDIGSTLALMGLALFSLVLFSRQTNSSGRTANSPSRAAN